MPELSVQTDKPRVVTNPFIISWKRVIVGLLVSTSLIGAGLVWYYYDQLKSLSPSIPILFPKVATPSAQKEETAGWKTYSNQTLGFSLKYPASWKEPVQSAQSTRTSVDFNDGLGLESLQGSRLEISRGVFYNQDLQRTLTFNEYIAEQSFQEDLTVNDETLRNWKGKRFTYHLHGVGAYDTEIILANPEKSEDIMIINYVLSPEESYPSSGTAPSPETLNKILSTFKFLD